MKKGIILAFAMFLTAYCPVFASITDLDIEKSEGGKSNKGPRTSSPSVLASTQGDELSIDVNRYLGIVQVFVMATDGSSVITNTYYINGHDTISMDFTGYAEGLYQMTVTLGNGDVYLGSFRIE